MKNLLRGVPRLFALFVIQAAMVVALLEIAGRALDPLGISYYPETARYIDTLILEGPIGYRNRPGLEGRFYGVPVAINSLGMRDREVGPRQPGEYRVLVMGDSVPFGIGVRVEDALPRQLERALAEREPGRRVRTLNLGVPSYNTEQELIQLRSLGLGLEPDAAILIFSSNDIEPKLWVLEKRKRWYVDLAQRSYAASLLYLFLREVRGRFGEPQVKGLVAGLDAPLVNVGEYRPDSPRWQAIDRSLAEINRLLRERRVRFVLFALNEPPPALDLLQGVARREGFEFFNLKRDEDPRWRTMDERLFHNSMVDGHPTPLGNAALATLIAESLARGPSAGSSAR